MHHSIKIIWLSMGVQFHSTESQIVPRKYETVSMRGKCYTVVGVSYVLGDQFIESVEVSVTPDSLGDHYKALKREKQDKVKGAA